MYMPIIAYWPPVRSGLEEFSAGSRYLDWEVGMSKEPNEVFFDITEGLLKVTITDNSARAVIAPKKPGWQPEHNFRLEVDARFTSDEWQNGLGLVFGASDDWSEYYDFKISFNFEQHYWAVARFEDNTVTYLTNGGWRGADPLKIYNQYSWNHLTVIRQGSEIQVMCNGENLPGGTFIDPSFPDNYWVGLTVTSYEWASGTMEFDNFQLTSLD